MPNDKLEGHKSKRFGGGGSVAGINGGLRHASSDWREGEIHLLLKREFHEWERGASRGVGGMH